MGSCHPRFHRVITSLCTASIVVHLSMCVMFVALQIAGPFNTRLLLADEPVATFVRGINLNGPELLIDGHLWQGKESMDYRTEGGAFENQSVALKPLTDAMRTQMLRSSRWGRAIDVELLNLEPGPYQVVLYVWEDNQAARYDLLVNDEVVLKNFSSGSAGSWRRLGPWSAKADSAGTIKLSARGGDANFSGIEIWSGAGRVPTPDMSGFNSAPTQDQLVFFENKIRPLLVERCYECHSVQAKEAGGNFLIDSRAGIVRGGDNGPAIVPGASESSLLLTAVKRSNPDLQMPPDNPLPAHEVEALARWIGMGAPDPRRENTPALRQSQTAIDWDKARDFWSLRPIGKPTTPAVDFELGTDEVSEGAEPWCLNEIDRFVAARLRALDLRPNSDAPPASWLRRATYDLTGLPPTVDELSAFEADDAPAAYERAVDRLLASSAYGERWGRLWLDVVRYADTAGDNSDFPIPQMVKYRDWVIDAFNDDLPYDQFVTQQLAGDLLPADSVEQRQRQIIATGYIAGARRFGSRVDDYPQHLTIEDTIDNLGRAFLAMTINCARCHDHKFDPVTSADYYALYGIFHSTRYPWPGIELEQKQRDLVPLVPGEIAEKVLEARKAKQNELDETVKRLTMQLKEAESDAKKELEEQLKSAKQAAEEHAKSALPYEQAYAVTDAATIEDVAIQLKGDPAKPGEVVERRFLTVLGGTVLGEEVLGGTVHGGAALSQGRPSSGRRELAEWIVDHEKNPLTARVIANRIWLHHFGRGLVTTPNDFGRQGKPPSHPELLDWLATHLIESGWSIKALHREIMLSRTYRQSSQVNAPATEVDPTGELLASFPRRRLDAESIRDTLLLLGGKLVRGRGPAHPFPPQKEWKFTQHNPFKAIYDTNYRSVYLMTQRIQRHPYLAIFDGPDPATSSPVRLTSTTPLQALYFLNDPLVHEQVSRFAVSLVHQFPDDSSRLHHAYLACFSREPSGFEVKRSMEFLQAVRQHLSLGSSVDQDHLELESWQALMRAMVRTNEFVIID